MAVALILLHAVNRRKAGSHTWAGGLAAITLCSPVPAYKPQGLGQSAHSHRAQTSESTFGEKVCVEGEAERGALPKKRLKNDNYVF